MTQSYDSLSLISTPRPYRSLFAFGAFLFLFLVIVFFGSRVAAAYGAFGVWSPTFEFSLYRFIVISLLPFLFNACMGAFFGMLIYRSLRRDLYLSRGMHKARHFSFSLYGFFAWCLIFNLPMLILALQSHQFSGIHWPPYTLYAPVSRELVIFIPMGNLGSLFGLFFGGFVAGFEK